MEFVRKGKPSKSRCMERTCSSIKKGIPNGILNHVIKSNMFPKAHAVAYVIAAKGSLF